ncbi:MAG: hypothetical protein Q7S40_23115, partial [Opitutaceae bacterium]|nr:hypothetical protein [Opitutaceae bacterium]
VHPQSRLMLVVLRRDIGFARLEPPGKNGVGSIKHIAIPGRVANRLHAHFRAVGEHGTRGQHHHSFVNCADEDHYWETSRGLALRKQ